MILRKISEFVEGRNLVRSGFLIRLAPGATRPGVRPLITETCRISFLEDDLLLPLQCIGPHRHEQSNIAGGKSYPKGSSSTSSSARRPLEHRNIHLSECRCAANLSVAHGTRVCRGVVAPSCGRCCGLGGGVAFSECFPPGVLFSRRAEGRRERLLSRVQA